MDCDFEVNFTCNVTSLNKKIKDLFGLCLRFLFLILIKKYHFIFNLFSYKIQKIGNRLKIMIHFYN